MRSAPILCTLIASCLLLGCASPMKPSPAAGPSPLVLASCPEPVPLSDDTMGALLAKVVELGNQYRECRAAALSEQ